jgi:N-acetylglucosamine malate deacetylase 1
VETQDAQGESQIEWRPRQVFHFIQDRYIEPDFVVDITPYWERKTQAMMAFKSQFFVPSYDSDEPQSYISSPEFLNFIKARAEEMGHSIGVKYGEGFTTNRRLGIQDLTAFI